MVGLSVLLVTGVSTVLPARTARAGDATEQLLTAAGFQVGPGVAQRRIEGSPMRV